MHCFPSLCENGTPTPSWSTSSISVPACYCAHGALSFGKPTSDTPIPVTTSLISLDRLGKRGGVPGSLWVDENAILPSSEDAARELEDAFVEGMALLRAYPLDAVGGVESVLQVAFDLAQRRQTEGVVFPSGSVAGAAGLGARLRDTVWNLASQANASIYEIAEEEGSEEEESEEEPQPPPKPSPASDTSGRLTLSSRLANTVWKGLTNQSAMEEPPSPVTASPVRSPVYVPSPLATSPPTSPDPTSPPPNPRASKIWGYAEKFRDSDTAATLAKVSTNWRVKALDAWSKRGSQTAPSTPASHLSPLPSISNLVTMNDSVKRGSLGVNPSPKVVEDQRRQSLPAVDRSAAYSPPARPAYFAPVRDSMLPEPRDSIISPTRSDTSAGSDTGSNGTQRRQDSLSSFVSLSRGPSPQPSKSGPRPLLLSSSSLITDHPIHQPQPVSLADKQWADTVRAKRPTPVHRHSQSSLSSLSPSDQLSRPKRAETAFPSDSNTSRIVPLHRKTPSPLPRSRRNMSVTLSPSSGSPPKTHHRIPTEVDASAYDTIRQKTGNSPFGRDSPTTGSSPPPHTPTSAEQFKDTIRVKTPDTQRGSMVFSDPGDSATEIPEAIDAPNKGRPDLALHMEDSDSSITRAPTRSARVRSKRYPSRLATLGAKSEIKAPSVGTEKRAPSPSMLAAPELSEENDPTTPRAKHFDRSAVPHHSSQVSPRRRVRKLSAERSADEQGRKLSKDGRARKIIVDPPRTRKVSNEGREIKHKRESAAVEGDDEGYDDLLSAYESEESVIR